MAALSRWAGVTSTAVAGATNIGVLSRRHVSQARGYPGLSHRSRRIQHY
jgi:hypothetical protein